MRRAYFPATPLIVLNIPTKMASKSGVQLFKRALAVPSALFVATKFNDPHIRGRSKKYLNS